METKQEWRAPASPVLLHPYNTEQMAGPTSQTENGHLVKDVPGYMASDTFPTMGVATGGAS